MKKFEKVAFTANKNTVTANKYVAHALYVQNEALVEKLGGQVIKGAGLFTAQFKTATKAKEFVANAVCSMSTKEYNATRKTDTKAKAIASAPKQGKGNKATTKKETYVYVVDANGDEYYVPTSVLCAPTANKTTTKKVAVPTPKKQVTTTKKVVASAPAPKKGKGSNKNFDFGKLVGKGSSANKQAAALIYKTGCKPNSAEFNKLWAQWIEVR